jgi:outer membrane biosynthesis protein TonB
MRFRFLAAILTALLIATVVGQQRPTDGTEIVKVTLDENLNTTVNGVPVQRYPNLNRLFLHKPTPLYPSELRGRHMTGSGTFRMYVDENGRVTGVKHSKEHGTPRIGSEATDALTR